MTAILKEEIGYTYIHTEGEHHMKKREIYKPRNAKDG